MELRKINIQDALAQWEYMSVPRVRQFSERKEFVMARMNIKHYEYQEFLCSYKHELYAALLCLEKTSQAKQISLNLS